MRHRLHRRAGVALIGLLGMTGTCAATPTSEVPQDRHGTGRAVRLGGHLPEISTWTAPIYADALKQARPWASMESWDAVGPDGLDAAGNPTRDARILFLAGSGPGPSSVVAGVYRLSFNGQAEVAVRDAGSVRNLSYDRSTNTTTADVFVPESGPNYYLAFTNTWRRPDRGPDATGNRRGIANARLMAPGHAWPQDYWRKEVVSMRQVFGVMQFEWPQGPGDGSLSANGRTTGVMGSGETTWGTRSRPNFLGYTAKGIPWEDVVVFANTVGVDVWVHIPIGADDDYIAKAFQLLRFGSDGNLPYTKHTHDPATWTQQSSWYPGLLPGRRVYVEFSNELFTYYGYGDGQAAAELAAGDPHHLAYDGKKSHLGDRWSAWNAVRISLIARQVWGDAAMQDAVRVVYANQGDWGGWDRHRSGLEYVAAVWGPGSKHQRIGPFLNPRKPVAHYLHSIAGSFYLHCASGTKAASSEVGQLGRLGQKDGSGFLRELKLSLSVDGGNGGRWESSVYQRHRWGEELAARYGVKLAAYETGIEIFQPGAVGDAWARPEMKLIYKGLLEHFFAQPHAEVAMQSATVRGVHPTNELSSSYAAADGFPWPLQGTPAPSTLWQAVLEVAAGR